MFLPIPSSKNDFSELLGIIRRKRKKPSGDPKGFSYHRNRLLLLQLLIQGGEFLGVVLRNDRIPEFGILDAAT